jgi:hypothetical protein
MYLANRLLVYLLLILGTGRALLYLGYSAAMLPLPLETHSLEAKMVLLAYRAQQGLELYPAWWDYPYVSNWFGPINSLLVGLLGRLAAADIRGLFLIGRAVSFGSGLLTSVVLAAAIGRRHGPGAGLAAGILSLGSGPMYAFTVMVRPDTLAEFLGTSGFLICGSRSRAATGAGVMLLVLAVLTKQTAAVFLIAAALAPCLAGAWRQGLGLFATATALLLAVVLAVGALFEPNFARSLVGERVMPWSYAHWRTIFVPIVVSSTDLLLLPAIGLALWLAGAERPRAVRPAVLTATLLGSALGLSLKVGSDLNYYMNLRVAEGMTVGALWHAIHVGAARKRPTWRAAALAVACLAAIAVLVPSLLTAHGGFQFGAQEAVYYDSPAGQRLLASYRNAFAVAKNPRVRMLTDSGIVDLYQGERALFGDPWLFRTLVETRQLSPTVMAQRIESQYYDVFIGEDTSGSPGSVTHDFRLPRELCEALRRRYVAAPSILGFRLYVRRAPKKGK